MIQGVEILIKTITLIYNFFWVLEEATILKMELRNCFQRLSWGS